MDNIPVVRDAVDARRAMLPVESEGARTAA
jgi:hypothetical protein